MSFYIIKLSKPIFWFFKNPSVVLTCFFSRPQKFSPTRVIVPATYIGLLGLFFFCYILIVFLFLQPLIFNLLYLSFLICFSIDFMKIISYLTSQSRVSNMLTFWSSGLIFFLRKNKEIKKEIVSREMCLEEKWKLQLSR